MEKDPLKPSQRLFVDEYLKTGNATEAYLKAYPAVNIRSAAASSASKLLRTAKIQKTMSQFLDDAGLTDEKLAQLLKDGTSAYRYLIRGNDVIKSPDYSSRHKYVRTALEVKDKIPVVNRMEVTGKDGQPIKLQILAGIGFLPNSVPKSTGDAPVATGGIVPKFEEIQGVDMAQEGEKDNNSDK